MAEGPRDSENSGWSDFTPPPPYSLDTSGFHGPVMDGTYPRDGSLSLEPKRKRFRPLRAVRKIFRRKAKNNASSKSVDEEDVSSMKSRSTSELAVSECPEERQSIGSIPFNSGLSLSHDSVFAPDCPEATTPEQNHGGYSYVTRRLSIKDMKDLMHRRPRQRQESDDDDVGLPHSPSTSPTTAEVLRQGLTGKSGKFRSSDGSLLSMGSSETDNEDGLTLNSSRLIFDRTPTDADPDLNVGATLLLNHRAAHHRIAVKPRRNHALPRHRRLHQVTTASSLPTTPEDNEELCNSSVRFGKSPLPSKKAQTSPKGRSWSMLNKPLPSQPKSPSTSRSHSVRKCGEVVVVGSGNSFAFSTTPEPPQSQDSGGCNKSHAAERKLRHEIAKFDRRRVTDREPSSSGFDVVTATGQGDTTAAAMLLSEHARDDRWAGGKENEPELATSCFSFGLRSKKELAEQKSEKGHHHHLAGKEGDSEGGPFFGKLFGSRRSGRKKKEKDEETSTGYEESHRRVDKKDSVRSVGSIGGGIKNSSSNRVVIRVPRSLSLEKRSAVGVERSSLKRDASLSPSGPVPVVRRSSQRADGGGGGSGGGGRIVARLSQNFELSPGQQQQYLRHPAFGGGNVALEDGESDGIRIARSLPHDVNYQSAVFPSESFYSRPQESLGDGSISRKKSLRVSSTECTPSLDEERRLEEANPGRQVAVGETPRSSVNGFSELQRAKDRRSVKHGAHRNEGELEMAEDRHTTGEERSPGNEDYLYERNSRPLDMKLVRNSSQNDIKRKPVQHQLSEDDIQELEQFGKSSPATTPPMPLPTSSPGSSESIGRPVRFSFGSAKDLLELTSSAKTADSTLGGAKSPDANISGTNFSRASGGDTDQLEIVSLIPQLQQHQRNVQSSFRSRVAVEEKSRSEKQGHKDGDPTTVSAPFGSSPEMPPKSNTPSPKNNASYQSAVVRLDVRWVQEPYGTNKSGSAKEDDNGETVVAAEVKEAPVVTRRKAEVELEKEGASSGPETLAVPVDVPIRRKPDRRSSMHNSSESSGGAEESELLKVFHRRSLKLKDSEKEILQKMTSGETEVLGVGEEESGPFSKDGSRGGLEKLVGLGDVSGRKETDGSLKTADVDNRVGIDRADVKATTPSELNDSVDMEGRPGELGETGLANRGVRPEKLTSPEEKTASRRKDDFGVQFRKFKTGEQRSTLVPLETNISGVAHSDTTEKTVCSGRNDEVQKTDEAPKMCTEKSCHNKGTEFVEIRKKDCQSVDTTTVSSSRLIEATKPAASVETNNSNSRDSKKEEVPQWLKLAQRRRELREKRENQKGSDEPVSVPLLIESKLLPTRSSKVLDLVNNFQKLQVS